MESVRLIQSMRTIAGDIAQWVRPLTVWTCRIRNTAPTQKGVTMTIAEIPALCRTETGRLGFPGFAGCQSSS